jgi:antirestriction protein ArdC
MQSNAEVYQKITDRMIAQLEQGTIPWQRPWTAANGGGRPRSMTTRQAYKGINHLLLAVEGQDKGYSSPWWGTYNQIAEKAGMVRRTGPRTHREYWASPDGTRRGVREGEKGTQIILWKSGIRKERDEATGEVTERKVLLARLFYVWNAEQAEQLPGRYYPDRAPAGEPVDEIRDAQEVLDGYVNQPGGPAFEHVEQDRAYYSGKTDKITMPLRSQFKTSEGYYSTAFHEAGHSTGHPSRDNRDGIANFDHFGSGRYGREELVAQMTSAMLQAETGIETPEEWDSSAAYVQSWLTAVKDDAKLIPQAAAAAQRAVERITEPQRQAELEDQADEPEREAA